LFFLVGKRGEKGGGVCARVCVWYIHVRVSKMSITKAPTHVKLQY